MSTTIRDLARQATEIIRADETLTEIHGTGDVQPYHVAAMLDLGRYWLDSTEVDATMVTVYLDAIRNP